MSGNPKNKFYRASRGISGACSAWTVKAVSQRAGYSASAQSSTLGAGALTWPGAVYASPEWVCISRHDLRRPEKPWAPLRAIHLFIHSLIHSSKVFTKHLTCPRHRQSSGLGSVKLCELISFCEVLSRTQPLKGGLLHLALEITVWLSRQSGLLTINNDYYSLRGSKFSFIPEWSWDLSWNIWIMGEIPSLLRTIVAKFEQDWRVNNEQERWQR